jgi:hypothetical protein
MGFSPDLGHSSLEMTLKHLRKRKIFQVFFVIKAQQTRQYRLESPV